MHVSTSHSGSTDSSRHTHTETHPVQGSGQSHSSYATCIEEGTYGPGTACEVGRLTLYHDNSNKMQRVAQVQWEILSLSL